jgi:hypothetical protein
VTPPAKLGVHALRGTIPARAGTPVGRPATAGTTTLSRAAALVRGRADLIAAVGLAVLCGGLALLTWGTWGDPAMDTGYDVLAGARTNKGDVPYADYVYFYGPLAPLLLGQLFDVFGTGIAPAFGAGLVLAALIVGATYALGRELAGAAGGFLAGALAATAALSSANNSFVMPHTFTAPLAVLFSLAALLAAIAAVRSGRTACFVAAGTCAGLVALVRAEFTLAIFAALGLWLVLRHLDSRPRGGSGRQALLVAGPALGIPALVYGLALTQVSLRELVTENLYPVDYLRDAGDVVLRAHAPLTPGSLAEPVAKLLLYACGAAALVLLGAALARRGRARVAAAVVAGVAAVSFLGVLAARPETVRHYLEFAYAWIPAGAWLMAGVLVWRFRRREGGWTARGQVELLAVVFLATIATKSYATFLPQPNPTHPPDTPYLLPFIGAFVAWLHLRELPRGRATLRAVGAAWLVLLVTASFVLVAGDARKETVTVTGTQGSLTALPADGPALQQAVDLIERETAPGDPILLAPQMTSLYTLSGRTNPLPQLSLLPGMLPDRQAEEAAIELLDLHNVTFAITDRTPMTTYEHGAFGETFDRTLARWIRMDFSRTATLRGSGSDPRVLDVWQRRRP